MQYFNMIYEGIKNLIYGRPNLVPSVPQVRLIETSSPSLILKPRTSVDLQNRVINLPFVNPRRFYYFTEQHRPLVYKYILLRLKFAIKYKWSYVKLFQFNPDAEGNAVVIQINADKYVAQLNSILSWCINAEEYESAVVCKQLMREVNTI